MHVSEPIASPSTEPNPVAPAENGTHAAETSPTQGVHGADPYDALDDFTAEQERLTERMARIAAAHRSFWRRIFG